MTKGRKTGIFNHITARSQEKGRLLPRTPGPTLNAELADWLRTEIRKALQRDESFKRWHEKALGKPQPPAIRRVDLVEAIRGRRGENFDDRTLRRYLQRGKPLARKGAIDLVLSIEALMPDNGLPYDLLDAIAADSVMPAVIFVDRGSAQLAEFLAKEARTMFRLQGRQEERLRLRLSEILMPYERFNDTPVGRRLIRLLKDPRHGLGKDWRARLDRIYRGNIDVTSRTPRAAALRRIGLALQSLKPKDSKARPKR